MKEVLGQATTQIGRDGYVSGSLSINANVAKKGGHNDYATSLKNLGYHKWLLKINY